MALSSIFVVTNSLLQHLHKPQRASQRELQIYISIHSNLAQLRASSKDKAFAIFRSGGP